MFLFIMFNKYTHDFHERGELKRVTLRA